MRPPVSFATIEARRTRLACPWSSGTRHRTNASADLRAMKDSPRYQRDLTVTETGRTPVCKHAPKSINCARLGLAIFAAGPSLTTDRFAKSTETPGTLPSFPRASPRGTPWSFT